MAYYTALITAWNGATQPPAGVTGTGLSSGMTTGQKLATLNAWTVTGSVPTNFTVTGSQLLNCVNYTEFKALAATQQSNLLALCNNPGPILGGSGNVSHIGPGMIVDYFPPSSSGPTIQALIALAQATVNPWYIVNGYPGPLNNQDLTGAGLS